MIILPCLFPGFEDFHSLQFPGKVLRVAITVISTGSSSLWYPWQAGLRTCIGCPALSPRREEGLVGWRLKSQQVCVGGRDLCSSIRPPP